MSQFFIERTDEGSSGHVRSVLDHIAVEAELDMDAAPQRATLGAGEVYIIASGILPISIGLSGLLRATKEHHARE